MTGEELIEEYKKGRRDFKGVDLTGVDLKKANLEGVNLSDANLEGADLDWADLRKANLKGSNLRRACLEGADLTGANIDFSCWPLWCGSRKVKVDKKIFCQLMAHVCTLNIDDKECKEAQNCLSKLARQSHVWEELNIPF